MEADSTGEPNPVRLRLDRSALALFDDLRQEAMQRARSSSGLASGWHGKTPGRALRLSLVFQLLAWSGVHGSEPRMISGDAMARAGCYLDYLAAMFDRVTAGLPIRRDEADAATTARHILSARATMLSERMLYQLPGWSWLRDSEGGPKRWARLPPPDGYGGQQRMDAEGRAGIGWFPLAGGGRKVTLRAVDTQPAA
jgi:hypothetical protein